MDINSIPTPPPQQQATTAFSGAAKGTLLPRQMAVQAAKQSNQKDLGLETPRHSESDRLERVRQAVKELRRDVFVVSDRTFTIFKDISGQYVTRFTSLRDGKVTYIPEPEIMEYMNTRRLKDALVKIDV